MIVVLTIFSLFLQIQSYKKTPKIYLFKTSKMNQENPEEAIPQIQQTQQELEEKARKIWKIFGRNTHAGRILHQVYQLPRAVKIDYPKPKAKPKTEETLSKIPKPCPQKTKIEYPPAKIIEEKKIAKVDLIPKRKNYEEIRKEIDEFYRNPVIPVNKGVDRGLLIEKTQKKFKELRGGLPKKAELPQINPDLNGENIENNEKNHSIIDEKTQIQRLSSSQNIPLRIFS